MWNVGYRKHFVWLHVPEFIEQQMRKVVKNHKMECEWNKWYRFYYEDLGDKKRKGLLLTEKAQENLMTRLNKLLYKMKDTVHLGTILFLSVETYFCEDQLYNVQNKISINCNAHGVLRVQDRLPLSSVMVLSSYIWIWSSIHFVMWSCFSSIKWQATSFKNLLHNFED